MRAALPPPSPPTPGLPVPTPVTVQLGLFGPAQIVDVHVVSAHTRLRADGSEVFVSEHLRWSRGRRALPFVSGAPLRPAPDAPAPAPEQLALWRS